jgi:hypothetical protein
VAEVTSFPVDKVAVGESPSVAMHVPVPSLRASPNGEPCTVVGGCTSRIQLTHSA